MNDEQLSRRTSPEALRDGGAGRRLTAEHVTARALVESASLAEAMPKILQAICEALGWEHGALWTVDPDAGVLRCVESWHSPGVVFPEFDRLSHTTTFPPGVGLPGRVWQSATPAWIPDVGHDANFPRAPVARREGLHSAFGFPILHGGSVRSVMEFFSREIREPDEDLLRMLGTVGSQIGLFLERRRAEEELDHFFRLSLDLLCIAGMDGRFRRVNPAWESVFGYREQELLATPYLELVHPEDRAATADEAAKLAAGGLTVSFENRYRCRDGSYRWLLWTATPSPDRTSIYAAARDITERKEAEATLALHAREQGEMRRVLEEQAVQQAQLVKELEIAKGRAEEAAEAKGEFLANMSHEVRTPLNAILGMTELTLRTKLSAEQRDYLASVKSSSHALLAIVNDVLDFSKIEARRLELESAPFDVRETIEDTARMLAFRAEEKGLELACQIAPDVQQNLVGDPGRLRQVLVNLIGNAIKFTDRGEIVVLVESAGEPHAGFARLRFSVRDTGIGVPPDRREHIFEAFVQADNSTTRRYGGTGLGLTIAARLVELMDGRLWFESNEEGGSTFRFTASFSGAPQPDVPRLVPRPAGLENLRVLVVDDNATNRRILEEMLEGWRMRPVSVESGKAALAALALAVAGERFDVVLTDYQMPHMHGLTLARRIRKLRGYARTPIILLTSSGRSDDLAKNRELGLAAALTKPIKHSDLLEAITEACGVGSGRAGRARLRRQVSGTTARAVRILVAEDNAVSRKLIGTLLRKRGHRVTTVENGREAVDAVARTRARAFDIVIMDVQMPIMGGLEAAGVIRERETTTGEHVPILALTAHAMKGDRERCLAAGMDAYLPKPIDVDQLIQTVETLAGGDADAGARTPPELAPEPTTPSAPSTDSTAPVPVTFDEESALKWTGGDPRLLRDVIRLFLADAPGVLRRIESAAKKGDGEALRLAAHALKGSAATIGAVALSAMALGLERIGNSEDLGSAPKAIGALREGLTALEESLLDRGFVARVRTTRPGRGRATP
jgi:two-component system, sensor histidine kinase and response regulator